MSRADALSPLTLNTQRVNAAVGVAVRRKMSEQTSIDNRAGLAHSIGKRIQREYGATLRALAEADPDLSATELCEAVVFPAEYPEDFAPDVSPHSGDRDRARHAHTTPPPEAPPIPADIGSRVADLRATISTEAPVCAPTPAGDSDPESHERWSLLRGCLDPAKADEAQAELDRRTGRVA